MVCLAVSRNSARFFWKSLPQEVKDVRPELTAVWRIGHWPVPLEPLLRRCLHGSAGVREWGPDLADFITAFLGIVLAFTFPYLLCNVV